MKRYTLPALFVLLAVTLSACGSSSSAPKATPTPTPTPIPTSTAVPTGTAASATPTAAATVSAVPSSTGIISKLPTWCGNLGSAQAEINKINAQLGGNPTVAQLEASLAELHTLIANDAASASGNIKKYFNELATAATSAAKSAKQYTGVLSPMEKSVLTLEVQAIATDWQVVKSYAGCGVIH